MRYRIPRERLPREVIEAMEHLKEINMNHEEIPNDPVNHPNHYIAESGMESIDVIKSFTADLQGFEAVATANALKYLMRWKNKNGKQDLKKARWYIEELIDYLNVKNGDKIEYYREGC